MQEDDIGAGGIFLFDLFNSDYAAINLDDALKLKNFYIRLSETELTKFIDKHLAGERARANDEVCDGLVVLGDEKG